MNVKNKTIEYNINKNKILIDVVFKNVKNLILKINKNNNLIVIIPFHSTWVNITYFLDKNVPKLYPILLKKIDNQKANYSKNGFFYVNNFKKEINFIEKNNGYSKCIENYNEIKVFAKKENEIEKAMIKYFKKKYYDIWFNIINDYLVKMNVEIGNFKITKMTSKWGSCNYEKKIINLNYCLLHFPTPIQEYVIVHELTHLIYPNHSKEFWNAVEKYIPNRKELEKELKQKSDI